jgi:hypothetical protein
MFQIMSILELADLLLLSKRRESMTPPSSFGGFGAALPPLCRAFFYAWRKEVSLRVNRPTGPARQTFVDPDLESPGRFV